MVTAMMMWMIVLMMEIVMMVMVGNEIQIFCLLAIVF